MAIATHPSPLRAARAAFRAAAALLAAATLAGCAPWASARGRPAETIGPASPELRSSVLPGGPPVAATSAGAGDDRNGEEPAVSATVRRRQSGFEPEFLVVSVGDRVIFRNDECILHRFFASSAANAFDLGVLARGSARSVCFERPGLVRFYCSLHEDEHGLILVVPGHFTAGGELRVFGLAHDVAELAVWPSRRPPPSTPVDGRPGVLPSRPPEGK